MQQKTTSPLHTVSPLPVLVIAREGDPFSGLANFYSGATRGTQKVRSITKKDLKREISILDHGDRAFLLAILELKKAYEIRDQFDLRRSWEKALPLLPSPWPGSRADEIEQREFFATFFSQTPDWAKFAVAQSSTKALEDARFVLWFSDKEQRFSPAVYCPNLKTAVFLKAFLGEIHVCPHCSKPFIPSHKGSDYCSPEHRERYRLIRWRARKRAEAAP